MGICELASRLSQGLSSRTRTIGGMAATAFLSLFLSHMPATYASAGLNDGDRSGQQQEDGDIEFYNLRPDSEYITNSNIYYINVPGEEASVRIIPQALKRTIKYKVRHNSDVQPALMVYQDGELIDYVEMNRVDKSGADVDFRHEISTALINVTLPDNYIKLKIVDSESGEEIPGIVASNEGETHVELSPLEGINVELTQQGENNFAEFELPLLCGFFTVAVTQDGQTQELNFADMDLRSSLNSNAEFYNIGGSTILQSMEPTKLQEKDIYGFDDRTRDYKAMTTAVLKIFYQEHRDVAKYLAQRGLEYRGGFIEHHVTGGAGFLTQIDFRTRTARIYEGGNSTIDQDPQVTFKVEEQRDRTRAFHEHRVSDSYITSDRLALNSLITALDEAVASYNAARELTAQMPDKKRKVLVVADEETMRSDTYQYLVGHLFFDDNLQFSLIDPNSEAGKGSINRYQSVTGQLFEQGSVLFEYMHISTEGEKKKDYMVFNPDYNVHSMSNFIDHTLKPIKQFVTGTTPSRPGDYIQQGIVHQPVE